MIFKCPGQDDRDIKAEIIKCPDCGYKLEIFSDEIKVKCPKCKNLACRERLPSCVDWCKYARECIGEEKHEAYLKNKFLILKDKLLQELEAYFGTDIKRIKHAQKVLQYGEEILKHEKADWHIVVPSCILHDVGIKIAEEKYGSNAGHLQEREGVAVARGILLKLGCKKEDIDQICQIIAKHHSPGEIDTLNFKVLYDADSLVNLSAQIATADKRRIKEIIDQTFFTQTGKDIAERIYLREGG